MFILHELKDIPLLSNLQKNHLDKQHRNNYSIPHKIWPVQEQDQSHSHLLIFFTGELNKFDHILKIFQNFNVFYVKIRR